MTTLEKDTVIVIDPDEEKAGRNKKRLEEVNGKNCNYKYQMSGIEKAGN